MMGTMKWSVNSKSVSFLELVVREKHSFIPTECISLADLENEDIEMITGVKQKDNEKKYVEETCYYLQNESIEGIEQEKRVFRLVKYIPSYKGESIDSVIVKRVGNNHAGQKFTLTKHECKKLGIDYEVGLEIYPSNFPFVKCIQNEGKECMVDNKDISKYYVSKDGRIHNIIIQISGCRYVNGFIQMPNGILIEDTLNKLKVYVNNVGFVQFQALKSNNMFKRGINGIVDDNGCIYLYVTIPRGVSPLNVRGISLNEFVTIKTSTNLRTSFT